jgi:hypothetical protein
MYNERLDDTVRPNLSGSFTRKLKYKEARPCLSLHSLAMVVVCDPALTLV